MRFHLPGMLNPTHEIVGSIRKLARDVIASADTIEWWADETASPRHTGNLVAGVAAILTYVGLT